MIYSYRSETLYRIIPDKYILSQESIKKKEIFFSFTITIVTKMSLNKKEKKIDNTTSRIWIYPKQNIVHGFYNSLMKFLKFKNGLISLFDIFSDDFSSSIGSCVL